MSINAIGNSGIYGGNGFCSGLSEETKRKLIALGIDPRTVASEAQAKILIENALKTRAASGVEVSKYNFDGERELIVKARNLASKMGIIVSNTMPPEQILKCISDKLDSGEGEEFKAEFASLVSAFQNIKQNENAMFASMNYSATLNKMMLGL